MERYVVFGVMFFSFAYSIVKNKIDDVYALKIYPTFENNGAPIRQQQISSREDSPVIYKDGLLEFYKLFEDNNDLNGIEIRIDGELVYSCRGSFDDFIRSSLDTQPPVINVTYDTLDPREVTFSGDYVGSEEKKSITSISGVISPDRLREGKHIIIINVDHGYWESESRKSFFVDRQTKMSSVLRHRYDLRKYSCENNLEHRRLWLNNFGTKDY